MTKLCGIGLLSLLLGAPALAHSAPLAFTLHWTDNATNELGFRGYRVSGPNTTRTKVCEVAADAVQCPVTDDVSTNPCYVVVAYNSFGESTDSNQACTARPNAPGTVTISVP